MKHTTVTSEGAPQFTLKVEKTETGTFKASVVGNSLKTVDPVEAPTEFTAINELKGRLQKAIRGGEF